MNVQIISISSNDLNISRSM